jgi:hypothetical protein
VKEDETDRVCSTQGEKMDSYRILVGNLRDHLEDLDICGRIILKGILDRMGWYGMD